MQVPGLAVVLVGTKGDSATYVRMKRKACADLGIQSFSADLPEDVTEEDLLKVRQPVTISHKHLVRISQGSGKSQMIPCMPYLMHIFKNVRQYDLREESLVAIL